MPGPFHSLLYIHNAIHKETYEFEDAVRELNRQDDGQIAAILEFVS